MSRGFLPLLASALLLQISAGATSDAGAADWPSFRGPFHTGQVTAPGVFEGEVVGLELHWKHRVGAGYSGMAIAGERVFTMAADGDADLLVALDAERGEELWRYRIGARTRGHDGSDDGPSVTPVVDGRQVFGASSRARLFALDASSGRELWSVSLVEALGGTVPLYEYSSTPLVTKDLVIAAVPGEAAGGSLAAFDRATGAHRWSAAPGRVDHQSPVLARLLGRDQILHWPGERVVGVDLAGQELWSTDAIPNQDASPLPIGDDRVLLYGFDRSILLRLREEGGAVIAERAWESRDLKGGNFSAPVYHDGHVYGFDRAFLSCIDAETGTRRWKSRPPGGSGLILVEDRLVVFGASGDVVIARATPDGYTEETRLRATARESLTWPAFAAGKVYVRDGTHVAAVRVTDRPTPEAAVVAEEPAPVEESDFGRFVRRLEAAADPAAKALLLEDFFRVERRYPILEGDLVHFVYRGPARDVAVAGFVWDIQEEIPLVQVAGTDFFYRTKKLSPMTRFEYLLNVDLENVGRDPLNPRTVPVTGRPGSESVPDGWHDPAYLAPYDGPAKARIERFTLASRHTGDEREIAVWLPQSKPEAVLVVINSGPWAARGHLFNTLDHLVGDTVAPLAAVYVPSSQQLGFLEVDGRNTAAFGNMLVEELLPELRRRFDLAIEREKTALLGLETSSNAAIHVALSHGDVFGRAILLDHPGTYGLAEDYDALLSRPPQGGAPRATFLSWWNLHGFVNTARGDTTRETAAAMTERLRAAGNQVDARERPDSFGWGSWRVMTAEALETVFPPSSR